MDTLKRYGSLRLSKRGRKQREQERKPYDDAKPKIDGDDGTLLPEPKFYTLGRKQKHAKAFFTISFKDVVVSTLNGYQPTHLKAVFERHRQSHSSDQVLWEPSLRCTSTGSGVWHPPFIIHTTITVPKLSKSSGGDRDSLVLRQKDAYVSIENVDIKRKRKLLAKARLNLSDYFESAAEKDVSFRLKLHPESSKIDSASIDLTLRKTVNDPRTVGTLDGDIPSVPLFPDVMGPSTSLGSPSHKSLDWSPYGSRKDESLKDFGVVGAKTTKTEMPTTPSENSTDISNSDLPPAPADDTTIAAAATNKPIVPNITTPPPLPPRMGGQKNMQMSQESPPPSSQKLQPNITSTPLDVTTNARAKSVETITEPAVAPVKPTPSRSSSPVFACPRAPLAIAEDSKTINHRPPVHTPPETEKEIDWSDDAADPPVQVPSQWGIKVSSAPRPSPKVQGKPSEKLSVDKDLIQWAESQLVNVKPQVKVTNLTSSWRNGLGFCLILQKSYPSLIPLKDLSMEHAKDNNEIAFDVADLLNIETDVVRQMALKEEKTDKTAITEFLQQLRLLTNDNSCCNTPSAETVIEFQKKWFKRRKYFQREVGNLCKEEAVEVKKKEEAKETTVPDANQVEQEEEPKIMAETKKTEFEAEATREMAAVETQGTEESEETKDTEEQASMLPPTSEAGCTEISEPCTSNRAKARRLIALALHESSSYEDPNDAASVCSDLVSSSTSCTATGTATGRLCESGTILEELSQLAREEEQISGELEKLELALRNQDVEKTDEDEFEALLQKYMSMVNEKNSLLRRQMQLNIAEKERAIEHKKDKLQRQLQKFSDLDDSQKTEAMRLEEEKVLQHYVEAVNEKNELVHDLDSQEKLIAEDERIRSLFANRDTLTSSSASKSAPGSDTNKHNIMNEFLDFFKKPSSAVSSGFSKK